VRNHIFLLTVPEPFSPFYRKGFHLWGDRRSPGAGAKLP